MLGGAENSAETALGRPADAAERAGLQDGHSTAESATIDWERLGLVVGTDAPAQERFLRQYVTKVGEYLDQLERALEKGNATEAELVAHRCKGASANFGMTALIAPMARLEAMSHSRDLSEGASSFAEARQAFARIRQAIADRFARVAPESET